MKMKLGLVGFGKTGKAVAGVIIQHKGYSLEWVLKQSSLLQNRTAQDFLGLESSDPGLIYSVGNTDIHTLLEHYPVDAIIDFSSREAIHFYGKAASEMGIRIISGISHYGEEEKRLLQELSSSTAVFWSPNITLGVNYLLFAAKFLRKIAPWVDIEIIEEHFKGKEGISGTAVKIAHALGLNESRINSVRAGGIVGKHEVIFGFPYQTVRLIHESISREAFGNGALFAAENMINKSPGLYDFENIFTQLFEKS